MRLRSRLLRVATFCIVACNSYSNACATQNRAQADELNSANYFIGDLDETQLVNAASGTGRLDLDLLSEPAYDPVEYDNADYKMSTLQHFPGQQSLQTQQGLHQIEQPTKPQILNLDLAQTLQPSANSRTLSEPNCARLAREINKFSNQGWNVKIIRWKTPDKCPGRCKNGYKGPKSGKYKLYCDSGSCKCTFTQGRTKYGGISLKDDARLSIVGALPAGCSKFDCIGGGYEFCRNC